MKRRRRNRKGVKGLITRASTVSRSYAQTDRGDEDTNRDGRIEDNNINNKLERGGQLERKLTTSFKRKNENSAKDSIIPRTRSSSLPVAYLSSPINNNNNNNNSSIPSHSHASKQKKGAPPVFFTPIMYPFFIILFIYLYLIFISLFFIF